MIYVNIIFKALYIEDYKYKFHRIDTIHASWVNLLTLKYNIMKLGIFLKTYNAIHDFSL